MSNTKVCRCRGVVTIDEDSCGTLLLGHCPLSPTLLRRGFEKLDNMLGLHIHFSLLNYRGASNINSNW